MLTERYVPRKISDVSPKDRKVSIVGRIIGTDPEKDSFVMEDDTGRMEILFNEQSSAGRDELEKEKGKQVRLFCILIGKQVHMDILQPVSGLDLNLLKTVDELYSKAGV